MLIFGKIGQIAASSYLSHRWRTLPASTATSAAAEFASLSFSLAHKRVALTNTSAELHSWASQMQRMWGTKQRAKEQNDAVTYANLLLLPRTLSPLLLLFRCLLWLLLLFGTWIDNRIFQILALIRFCAFVYVTVTHTHTPTRDWMKGA